MKRKEYEQILASLERALAVFEAQPLRFGFDDEAYEKLKEVKASLEKACRNKASGGRVSQ